ncbi:MAG: hypothetical protein R3C69_04440 [Geminicoccaceae bacterium]
MLNIAARISGAILACLVAMPIAWAQEGAVVEQTAIGTALVHDVDLTTRQVLLETEDGSFVTVVAPPEVRNLPQVEVGDTVTIGYYGGIVASLVPPGSEPIATQGDTSLLRAEEGERPAGATVTTLDTSVTFQAFDADTGSVSFKPQEGPERSLVVRDPDMRAFVETLKPGDVVQVTLVEVIALVVDPAL